MSGIIISAVMSLGGPGVGFRFLMNPWVQEEIGLTQDQSEKLAKIISDHITSTASLRAEMLSKRLELRTELSKEKPDMAKVEKLTGEISSIQAKLLMARIRTEIAIKNLLTPEQKSKLNELRASRPGKGGKGRLGKGPGPMWF
jgi:Spy/CpxP family protein refolding chaperone